MNTACLKMSLQNEFTNHLIYMYKQDDLTSNNEQWLICHKTKPNQTRPNQQNESF